MILYAPKGSGMLLAARYIMEHYGLHYLVQHGPDIENRDSPNVLILTTDSTTPNALDFYKVLREVHHQKRTGLILTGAFLVIDRIRGVTPIR